MRDLTHGFRLFGGSGIARVLGDVLLEYARVYAGMPLHSARMSPDAIQWSAKLTHQTLNEAMLSFDWARAYDVISSAGVLTPAERVVIEGNLMRGAAEAIRRNNAGLSNWQSHHNAALYALGALLNDRGLTGFAVTSFEGQVRGSVFAGDAMWQETSVMYHYFAAGALFRLALVARNHAGLDLFNWRYEGPDETGSPVVGFANGGGLSQRLAFRGTIEALLTAPLALVLPTYVTPRLQDDDGFSALAGCEWWETGRVLWPQRAVFRQATRAFCRRPGPIHLMYQSVQVNTIAETIENTSNESTRTSMESEFPLGSAVLGDAGYVVQRLEAAGRRQYYVTMHWGPFLAHGHYDKLALVWFHGTAPSDPGGYLVPDLGRTAYSLPLHYEYLVHSLSQRARPGTRGGHQRIRGRVWTMRHQRGRIPRH